MISKFLYIICIFFISNSFAQKKVSKTDAEWKEILTDKQYYILRQKGTEYPDTGEYNKFYEKGTYHCAACNTPLFSSKHKFNSGTGWPSFDTAIQNNVAEKPDYKNGWVRTEILCNICDGHLGHVFNDGPKETTGLRYCVNSLSLKFVASKEKLQD